MQKTTQEIINNIVWKTCDTFRGTMDGSNYKDYILTILFVKYLSDFYKEKREILKKEYGNKRDRIEAELTKEKFKLDESCTFEYLKKYKESSNLGEKMNKTLEKIEENNKDKLEDIFRSIDFNNKNKPGDTKERNALLKNLIEDFSDSRLNLHPSMLKDNDCLGDAYEYLIAHFASDAGKKGGEFYTPSEVSTLRAKLVETKEGDKIYDRTCESGSLLIKAAKEVGNKNFRLYEQTHALCKMNMFLHEINDTIIEWGDTIRNPLHLQDNLLKTFDKVIANPPFSLDKWGDEVAKEDSFGRFKFGIPPSSKRDFAFILHMLSSLDINGTMGVICPHSVLFRGASEGKIRQNLIEQNLLDCVIGLPVNLFFSTSIPACILIFKKNKAQNNILFIDASKEFEKDKNQNRLTSSNTDKIFQTYKKRKNIKGYAQVVSFKNIKQNEYNLNIPRYVDSFEEEEEADLEATKQEMQKLELELQNTQNEINKYLKELELQNETKNVIRFWKCYF